MSGILPRDENHVTAVGFESSTTSGLILPGQINEVTGRILTSMSGGSGTVQDVSVATANGFAGTSDADPVDPTLTLTTTITGILKGNGTAISAVTIGSGLTYDGTTLSATGGGTGDVVGPASSTDNAIVRFDGLTGKLIQDYTSGAPTISDTGAVTIPLTTGNSLVVDTSVLVADATNNRVGINTASPATDLDVNGILRVSASAVGFIQLGANTRIRGGDSGWTEITSSGSGIKFWNNTQVSEWMTILNASGNVGIGQTTPTAVLHLRAGTATASTAPLKLTAGTALTTPEAGTLEFTNSETGLTFTAVSTRRQVVLDTATQTLTGKTLTSPAITTSITTGSTSFDAFNTTATTLNFAGAATTLTIGATTGTLNLRNVTLTAANATSFAMNGASPAITTTSTGTVAVFNTGALVGNLFGAATTLTIGGTPTTAVTHNYSTNATAAATTKTVNLGTGGAASSTTNVNIGSANGGTTNIASPTLQNNGVVVPTISSTNTLTNKRITRRTGTTTSSATPTINTDNVDYYSITAQAVDITSMTTNLSGTPTTAQQLRIDITGTAARAITWGASFANGPVALPTTTVTTTRLYVLLEWDGSIWRCMASGSTV